MPATESRGAMEIILAVPFVTFLVFLVLLVLATPTKGTKRSASNDDELSFLGS